MFVLGAILWFALIMIAARVLVQSVEQFTKEDWPELKRIFGLEIKQDERKEGDVSSLRS